MIGVICFWEFQKGVAVSPEELHAHMQAQGLGKQWYPPRVDRIANVRKTGKLFATDLTRIFVANITKKMYGISLKDAGGVYYVPALHLQALLAHSRAAVALSGRFTLLSLADTPESATVILGLAKGALSAQVQKLAQQVGQSKIDLPRPTTLRRRSTDLKQLLCAVTHYDGLGAELAEQITTAIKQIDTVLAECYGIYTSRILRKQVLKKS